MKKIKKSVLIASIFLLCNCIMFTALATTGIINKSVPDDITYKGINIANSPLFDKNNVAPAINDTVSKLNSGEKAYLEYGNYGYSETINIMNTENNLSGCTIELDGVYTQPAGSMFAAMNVNASNLTLKVNKIQTDLPADNFTIERPTGIHIENAVNCNFELDQISGFLYGMLVSPTQSKYDISGNNISFRFITSCNRPILVSTEPGVVSSVHDNVFTGGRLKGETGLSFFKGSSQTERHKNNIFRTVAFESIEKQGIILDYAEGTQFTEPRFESVMWTNIYESENTTGSKYISAVPMAIDKLDLYSTDTYLKMPIYNVAWETTKYWENKINTLYIDGNGKTLYEFAERRHADAAAGRTELPLDVANVDIDAAAGAVTLALYKGTGFEGNEIMLYAENAANGFIVVDYSGNTIYTSSSDGVYRMIYENDKWNVIKVSKSVIR